MNHSIKCLLLDLNTLMTMQYQHQEEQKLDTIYESDNLVKCEYKSYMMPGNLNVYDYISNDEHNYMNDDISIKTDESYDEYENEPYVSFFPKNFIFDLVKLCFRFYDNLEYSLSNRSIKYYKEKEKYVNWNYITSHLSMSQDFMLAFKGRLNWQIVSRYQFMTEDFIEKYKDEFNFNWYHICKSKYINASDEFKLRHRKKYKFDKEILRKRITHN